MLGERRGLSAECLNRRTILPTPLGVARKFRVVTRLGRVDANEACPLVAAIPEAKYHGWRQPGGPASGTSGSRAVMVDSSCPPRAEGVAAHCGRFAALHTLQFDSKRSVPRREVCRVKDEIRWDVQQRDLVSNTSRHRSEIKHHRGVSKS
jgi:hypothetical protein